MSGEALSGSSGFGIDPEVVQTIAREVAEASLAGVQVAVVVGGGMLARALYDRRQAKKARAKGDAQILEDAADA